MTRNNMTLQPRKPTLSRSLRQSKEESLHVAPCSLIRTEGALLERFPSGVARGRDCDIPHRVDWRPLALRGVEAFTRISLASFFICSLPKCCTQPGIHLLQTRNIATHRHQLYLCPMTEAGIHQILESYK